MRTKRAAQSSRSVTYHLEGQPFDESAAEKLLQKAKEDGLVTEFDTGRGNVLWFNGRPGPELRALKKKLAVITGA